MIPCFGFGFPSGIISSAEIPSDILSLTGLFTLNLANNNFYSIALANNITLANPTGIGNTQSGSIFLTQDSTGNRTVTFGSYWRFPSGSAPSLSTTANAQDRLDYVVFASNNIHTSVTLDLLGT